MSFFYIIHTIVQLYIRFRFLATISTWFHHMFGTELSAQPATTFYTTQWEYQRITCNEWHTRQPICITIGLAHWQYLLFASMRTSWRLWLARTYMKLRRISCRRNYIFCKCATWATWTTCATWATFFIFRLIYKSEMQTVNQQTQSPRAICSKRLKFVWIFISGGALLRSKMSFVYQLTNILNAVCG